MKKATKTTRRTAAATHRTKIVPKSERPTAPRSPSGPTVEAPPASTEAVVVATEAARSGTKAPAASKAPNRRKAATAKNRDAQSVIDQLFPPSLTEEWKQEKEQQQQQNIRAARDAYTRRGLVLYLGAGVSCSVGLPTWWEMIRALTVKMMTERVGVTDRLSKCSEAERTQAKLSIEKEVATGTGADQSILMLARSIKEYFKDRLPFELAKTLYAPLSKGFGSWLFNILSFSQWREKLKHTDTLSLEQYPAIKKSALFHALVQLARAQRDVRGVEAIVNFNYDDLIDEWMRENGIRCDTLLSGQRSGRDASLSCYHVHGVLPFRKMRDMKEADAPAMRPLIGNFVFSEDEYHTEYSDPYRWSNMTMINQLGRYSGLFIGLSLLDPNLRRLIDVTHRQYPDIKNYAILTRKVPPSSAEDKQPLLRDLFEKVETESFEKIGVQVIWTDTYDQVPLRILEICNIDYEVPAQPAKG